MNNNWLLLNAINYRPNYKSIFEFDNEKHFFIQYYVNFDYSLVVSHCCRANKKNETIACSETTYV